MPWRGVGNGAAVTETSVECPCDESISARQPSRRSPATSACRRSPETPNRSAPRISSIARPSMDDVLPGPSRSSRTDDACRTRKSRSRQMKTRPSAANAWLTPLHAAALRSGTDASAAMQQNVATLLPSPADIAKRFCRQQFRVRHVILPRAAVGFPSVRLTRRVVAKLAGANGHLQLVLLRGKWAGRERRERAWRVVGAVEIQIDDTACW